MKKHLLPLAILSIAIFSGCKKNLDQVTTTNDLPVAAEVAANVAPAGQFVPNELLIKFKSGTSEKNRTQSLSLINGKVSEHILTSAMVSSADNEGIYLVNTSSDVFAAMARMKGENNVEYAEPNWIYNHYDVSDDTYYTNGSLWGMYGDGTTPANQWGSQAGEAWAGGHTGSSSVYVGVIDEGAMFTHPDLTNNFWNNPFEAADGVDNDGNGYVDDARGWDFANGDNTTFDGVDDDHGTHVSGTIGAAKNGLGVVGVSWNVKLISAKFLGKRGGTTANAIKAVDYFTDLKTRHGLNIVATNNSWGGGGASSLLQAAIERANAANILFIAAAGNDGLNTESSTNYPSGYPNANIIAVASITNTGAISSFSNYAKTKVDIGAPGSGIWSDVPMRSSGAVVAGLASYSGTSMATPHVTGGAALYAASNPGATAAQIKNAILGSAVPTASLTGKCVTGGRLNVSGF